MNVESFLKKLIPAWFRKGRECQHPGCTNPAIRCELPKEHGYPIDKLPEYEYFCVAHAHKHGYCWRCGHYWAGCESFDFSLTGLCENCQSEMDAEIEAGLGELKDYWPEP